MSADFSQTSRRFIGANQPFQNLKKIVSTHLSACKKRRRRGYPRELSIG
jgi:hypothetical protein